MENIERLKEDILKVLEKRMYKEQFIKATFYTQVNSSKELGVIVMIDNKMSEKERLKTQEELDVDFINVPDKEENSCNNCLSCKKMKDNKMICLNKLSRYTYEGFNHRCNLFRKEIK